MVAGAGGGGLALEGQLKTLLLGFLLLDLVILHTLKEVVTALGVLLHTRTRERRDIRKKRRK